MGYDEQLAKEVETAVAMTEASRKVKPNFKQDPISFLNDWKKTEIVVRELPTDGKDRAYAFADQMHSKDTSIKSAKISRMGDKYIIVFVRKASEETFIMKTKKGKVVSIEQEYKNTIKLKPEEVTEDKFEKEIEEIERIKQDNE